MNIQDYKIGDIAVFRDGTEAKIVNYRYRDDGKWLLLFDKKVKGWTFSGYMDCHWVYLANGKLDNNCYDSNDIVKIIRS